MSIKSIRKRLEAATPGPWRVENDGRWSRFIATIGGEVFTHIDGYPNERVFQDADFIAHAPTDVSALLKVVEALDECASLSPWEGADYRSKSGCIECGSEGPHAEHYDFCPWLKLETARGELEGLE